MEKCPLCGRELGDVTSAHHLIPRSQERRNKNELKMRLQKGIRKTVELHPICHDTIHQLFTLKELAKDLNTIEKIKKHPKIQPFLKNIKTKPIDFYFSIRKLK